MEDIGSLNSTVELKKTVIHLHQITVQHFGSGRSLSKIEEEAKTVDTDGQEMEKIIKQKVVFLTSGWI